MGGVGAGVKQLVELRHVVDGRDEQWPRNPLIAAVVWQLPKDGPFAAEARSAWLKMMATAFDVAYGPIEAGAVWATHNGSGWVPDQKQPSVAASMTPKAAHTGHDFYVFHDGTACRASDGETVLVSDIPADEMIFDYREVTGEFRDTAAIRWADGATGIKGIAPGVSFCGPG